MPVGPLMRYEPSSSRDESRSQINPRQALEGNKRARAVPLVGRGGEKSRSLREYQRSRHWELGMLVELIRYPVARAALPFLSFGWIHLELFSASQPSPRARHVTVATRMDGSNYDRTLRGSQVREMWLLVLLGIAAVLHGMSF